MLLTWLLTMTPGRATEPSKPTPAGPFADMVLSLGRVPFFDDARKLLGNPLMIERLDVIGRTEPIPNEPIVCQSDLPFPLIARLREAFLALDAANPEHRAYLTIDADDFQGFVAATDEDYESARRLLATVDAAAPSTSGPATDSRLPEESASPPPAAPPRQEA